VAGHNRWFNNQNACNTKGQGAINASRAITCIIRPHRKNRGGTFVAAVSAPHPGFSRDPHALAANRAA
jgi:hypothetical protein